MIRESFNRGWTVQKAGASTPAVGPVTLPYDAMLFERRDAKTKNGGNTGFFPGGEYRYTKTFTAPADWADKTVVLEFEGVHHRSRVFVNGTLASYRPSGYALFHVTLDDLVEYGSENTVEVVSDNTDEPNSRWYTGSGIYRPVHLLIGDRTHVLPTGLRIVTEALVGTTATVSIATTIHNPQPITRTLRIATAIAAPDGTTVATIEDDLEIGAATDTTVRQQVSIPRAALWSPETPRLHVASVTVLDDDTVLDTVSDDFGVRTLSADPKNGLRINGTPVKMRGAAIHHDNGVIGAHTLDAAEDRRIRLLKAAGFNAVRSAHNPASRALLRACDRHGVLVMDELTDAWFRPKVKHDYSEHFEEWWERDLEALVANAHNHPSVVMYSIGNEISDTVTSRGVEMNRTLAKRVRELDPTRLSTNSINGFLNLIAPQDDAKIAAQQEKSKNSDENPNRNLIRVLNLILGILDKLLDRIVRLPAVDKRTRDVFAEVDVAGYNYMVGRYELDGRLHPHRVIVGSETRAALTAKIWPQVERLPYVIGDFAWTGWDYIGEAGLATKQYGTKKRSIYQPYPALLADEPVIDITGFRQSQSYLNEIAWHLTKGPHVAVEPVNHSGEPVVQTGWRTTNSVPSWSWAGCEGREATVEVYADAARIDLLLDGRVVGTAPGGRDDLYLSKFTLPYAPGALTAVAYEADGTEIGRETLVTAGPELRLHVEPETPELRADGADLLYLPILLTDAAGTVKPLADRDVTVTVDGPATLLGLGSAEAITTEGFASESHRTFFGRAQAVLRAQHEPGDVTVTVSAAGCEPVSLTVPAVAVTTARDTIARS